MEDSKKAEMLCGMFAGATFQNSVVVGIAESGARISYKDNQEDENKNFTDEQIATAIENICGEDKPLDTKQKWAAIYWYLRWNCNFPINSIDFCKRIEKLPFSKKIVPECEYNNIRKFTHLSFMDQNATNLDEVKPSKCDEPFYFQCREVVNALSTELEKQAC